MPSSVHVLYHFLTLSCMVFMSLSYYIKWMTCGEYSFHCIGYDN